VYDGFHVGPRFVNFSMYEALSNSLMSARVDRIAIKVKLHDFVGRDQPRIRIDSVYEVMVRIHRMPHAQVAETIVHALVDQNVVCDHEIVNQASKILNEARRRSPALLGGLLCSSRYRTSEEEAEAVQETSSTQPDVPLGHPQYLLLKE
jgi:hypothetical protein